MCWRCCCGCDRFLHGWRSQRCIRAARLRNWHVLALFSLSCADVHTQSVWSFLLTIVIVFFALFSIRCSGSCHCDARCRTSLWQTDYLLIAIALFVVLTLLTTATSCCFYWCLSIKARCCRQRKRWCGAGARLRRAVAPELEAVLDYEHKRLQAASVSATTNIGVS